MRALATAALMAALALAAAPAAAQTYEFLFEFGSSGDEEGQFNGPSSVAIDPDGNIVVADSFNHRIQVCDPSGTCTVFGSQGNVAGQFGSPSGVAVDGDGNIVVADTDNHRIQICDPTQSSVSCVAFGSYGAFDSDPGQFWSPGGVAVDPDSGAIVVADTINSRIQVCNPPPSVSCAVFGSFGSEEPGQLNFPRDVAVDPDSGTIVVADSDNDRIQICDASGTCTAFGSEGSDPEQFDFPLGVTVDPHSGAIVVADTLNHRIQICDRGPPVSCVAFGLFGREPGQFDFPTGVAVDPHNRNIVVADRSNDRIQVFGLVDKAELKVAFDIRPRGCPNVINPRASGLLPTAILGTADVDVIDIDPDTVRLEGVAPTRFGLEDVATPFEPFLGKESAFDCADAGPDARLDLTLHFNLRSLVAALGPLSPGDVQVLQVTGELHDGTAFVGEDVVVVPGR